MSLIVETEGDPAAIAAPLREAVRGLPILHRQKTRLTIVSIYGAEDLPNVLEGLEMVAAITEHLRHAHEAVGKNAF